MAPADSACPICGKPSQARFAPFCSGRCADIDLGRWLKGGYAIPGGGEEDKAAPEAPSDAGPEPGEAPDR